MPSCFAPPFPPSPEEGSTGDAMSDDQWDEDDVPGWPFRLFFPEEGTEQAAASLSAPPLGAEDRAPLSGASSPDSAQCRSSCGEGSIAQEDAHLQHGDCDRSRGDHGCTSRLSVEALNQAARSISRQEEGCTRMLPGEATMGEPERGGDTIPGLTSWQRGRLAALSFEESIAPSASPAESVQSARRRGVSFSSLFAAARFRETSPASRMPIPRTHSSNSAIGFGWEQSHGGRIPRTFSVGSAPGSPASSVGRQRSTIISRLGSLTPVGGASPIPSRLFSLGKALKKKLTFGDAPAAPAEGGRGRRARRRFRRNQRQAQQMPTAKRSHAGTVPASTSATKQFSTGDSARQGKSVAELQRKLSQVTSRGIVAGAFLALREDFANSASGSPASSSKRVPAYAAQLESRLNQKPVFFSGPVQYNPALQKAGPASQGQEPELDRKGAMPPLDGPCNPKGYLTPFDIVPNAQEVTSQWSQRDWYLFVSAAHAGLRSGPSAGVPEGHVGATQKLLQQLLAINVTPSSFTPNASSDTSELGGSNSPGGSPMTSSDSGESVSDGGRQSQPGLWAEETGSTSPEGLVQSSPQDQGEAPVQQTVPHHLPTKPAAFDMGALGPSACPHLAALARAADQAHASPSLNPQARCPASTVRPSPANEAEAQQIDAEETDSSNGPVEQSTSSIEAPATFDLEACGESGASGETGSREGDTEDEEEDGEDDSWESVMMETVAEARQILLQDKTPNGRHVCEHLLSAFLDLTGSEMGFIASAHCKADGKMFLKTHAITNIGWTPELKRWYSDNKDTGLVFSNMNTLFGSVVTSGNVVISNQPESDTRSHGVPLGHPTISAFLGIPLFAGAQPGGKLIGVLAAANTDEEYSDDLVEDLSPLISAASSVLTQILHSRRPEPQMMQGIAEEAEEDEEGSDRETEATSSSTLLEADP